MLIGTIYVMANATSYGRAIPADAKVNYWNVLCASPLRRLSDIAELSFGLNVAARRAAQQSAEIGAFEAVADRWLTSRHGGVDDTLRRAALAAAALDLPRRASSWLPNELLEQHAVGHMRLAATLVTAATPASGAYTRDVAFVTGLALPAGAMTLFIPPVAGPSSLVLRSRRTAGQLVRRTRQMGAIEAGVWLKQARLRPWAEFHLDSRYLQDFNAEGLHRTYLRVAALLRVREDLSGLCGASWFYDPAVVTISPRLAFLRLTAEKHGAVFLRLREDPTQTALAVQTSPTRRNLVENGTYRPICYGMYWQRSDLLAWAADSEKALAPSEREAA